MPCASLQPARRLDDVSTGPVRGEVLLVQIYKDRHLILCHSQRENGAYERLGLLDLSRNMAWSFVEKRKELIKQLQSASTCSDIKII